jgi:hypothetical protein
VRLDLSPAAIDARLREASRLAGSLRPEHRLTTKIDLSANGVARRLRTASDLLQLCLALAQVGAREHVAQVGQGAPPADTKLNG